MSSRAKRSSTTTQQGREEMSDHQNEEASYLHSLHTRGFTCHIRTEEGAKNFYCHYSSYGSEGNCLGARCYEWIAFGSLHGFKIGTCGIDLLGALNEPEDIPI